MCVCVCTCVCTCVCACVSVRASTHVVRSIRECTVSTIDFGVGIGLIMVGARSGFRFAVRVG